MRVLEVQRVEDIGICEGILYRLVSDDLDVCNGYRGLANVLYTGDIKCGLEDHVHYIVSSDGLHFNYDWVMGQKRDGGVMVIRFPDDFRDLESCYQVQVMCDFPLRFVGDGLRSDMGVNVGIYGFDNVGVEPDDGYMCKGLDIYPVYDGVAVSGRMSKGMKDKVSTTGKKGVKKKVVGSLLADF